MLFLWVALYSTSELRVTSLPAFYRSTNRSDTCNQDTRATLGPIQQRCTVERHQHHAFGPSRVSTNASNIIKIVELFYNYNNLQS
jgi:hypothetical protein